MEDVESEFYKLSATFSNHSEYQFGENLRGKVVLIVNVASRCCFTHQYRDLQNLHKKYHPKGLVVLAFPCNQFGQQEPGSDDEIGRLCVTNFGVTFPVFKKAKVNGSSSHEVFKYLKSQQVGTLGLKSIKWNFEKFLIDKNGKVVKRYSSMIKPNDFENLITDLLSHTNSSSS